MSDINISYKLNHSPKPIGVNIDFSVRRDKLRITLQNVPRVLVTAEPRFTGSLGSDIISAVVTPMTNAFTLSLGLFATEILSGKSFNIDFGLDPFPFSVLNTRVTLNPSNINVSNHQGMLMVDGDFSIT